MVFECPIGHVVSGGYFTHGESFIKLSYFLELINILLEFSVSENHGVQHLLMYRSEHLDTAYD